MWLLDGSQRLSLLNGRLTDHSGSREAGQGGAGTGKHSRAITDVRAKGDERDVKHRPARVARPPPPRTRADRGAERAAFAPRLVRYELDSRGPAPLRRHAPQ